MMYDMTTKVVAPATVSRERVVPWSAKRNRRSNSARIARTVPGCGDAEILGHRRPPEGLCPFANRRADRRLDDPDAFSSEGGVEVACEVVESFTSTAVRNCSAPAPPRRRARRQAETDIEAGEEREFSAPHRQIRLFDSTSGQALGSVEDPAVRPERPLALSA
jgi:hypothetical protein